MRYQSEEKDNDNQPRRGRGRIRLRAGLGAQINERWAAGFGISSGGANPRSSLQTFDNNFETGDLRLDYAYGKYRPLKFLDITGGKFKNPLWEARTFLWDSDIRPEGVAMRLSHKISPEIQVFSTLAFFVLDEFSNDSSDPVMWAFQPGIKWNFTDKNYLKLAGAYYAPDNLRGNNFPYSAGTNSTDAAGKLVNDYKALAGDMELGLGLKEPIPFIALLGQYVSSSADDAYDLDGNKDNEGWLLGIKFGDKKVSGLGDWQVVYNYRHLERDAWPDFLCHSSFYNGSTNAKGNEVMLSLGISKNVNIVLDYFKAKQIRLNADNLEREQEWLALDLNLKW